MSKEEKRKLQVSPQFGTWYDVEEVLPQDAGEYLICCDYDGGYVNITYYHPCYAEQGSLWKFGREVITHWMPLPAHASMFSPLAHAIDTVNRNSEHFKKEIYK